MKKVLQRFFGKITILVSMLLAFSYTGTSQITVSMANCTITTDEIQMDILLTNTGADLRWNSPVLRVTIPAAILPSPVTLGTYSFNYVGGSDFPLSWPAVFPAPSFGASFNTTSRLLTWTTGNTSAYNNLSCPATPAPIIPAGSTKNIGRFSFKI